ncbi:MAG: hypothetical protein DMG64_20530 [Acidobacteria bacterium]|nr:MAG: hypothetical protein DMG63_18845 [Acidobacteriota bacterium]PYX98893.1 MAG: hypothetical protein DMG64_20530 [Acidobacteriota bacterium]PYY22106.1 MAG: hypothetical protein DMG62_15390 [Acidobacteriota bacterium]
MDREAKTLRFPAHDEPDSASEQDRSVASRVDTTTALLTPPPSSEPPPPVWMQRFFLVSTVIFCLWVGLVLCVLPWLPAWTENALVNDFPGLRSFLGTGFIRGLASGLGLLDLWIGISEAVHYRDRR